MTAIVGLSTFVATLLIGVPVLAQDASTTASQAQVEAPPSSGPRWRLFSQSEATSYLVDQQSIVRTGDEASIRIARVSKRLQPGDYSHVVDQFAIRCRSDETRVEATSDIGEDGETADTYPADEPWSRAAPGSFDDSVKQLACGEMETNRPPFDAIRAWIDAGRP